MLAPRKKLWSTPKEGVIKAIELLNIQPSDIIYDIGCGDGNFLFTCFDCIYQKFLHKDEYSKEQLQTIHIIGIDIEESRITSIKQKLIDFKQQHIYPEEHEFLLDQISVTQGNALEFTYANGTCFYLYLIPRGLKQIIELLLGNIHHPFRVVTFMYPIPHYPFNRCEKVHSEKHQGSQWPLYYYEFPIPSLGQKEEMEIEKKDGSATGPLDYSDDHTGTSLNS